MITRNKNFFLGAFLRAVLCVRQCKYAEARQHIDKVRSLIDSELTAMAAESYERAYNSIVFAQQLT